MSQHIRLSCSEKLLSVLLKVVPSRLNLVNIGWYKGYRICLSSCLTHTQYGLSVSLTHTHTHWHSVRSLHNLLPSACQADCRQMTSIRPGQAQAVRRRALTANTRLPFHSNNVGFVVDKVALVQGVLRILQLSPVSIIPPAHQTYLVIYQQRYIFPANHSLLT
jgi:hypothetical protein